MIYTPGNTALKGRPLQILLDGKEIAEVIYLDRRRRVIRRWKTDEDGIKVIENNEIPVEEIRYGHRQKLTIRSAK